MFLLKTIYYYSFNFSIVTQPVPPTLELSTPMVGRSNLYCQTCDLSFTSNAHATQHYEGKNHAKKVKAGYNLIYLGQ